MPCSGRLGVIVVDAEVILVLFCDNFQNPDWVGREIETLRAAGIVYESVSEGEKERTGRERDRGMEEG